MNKTLAQKVFDKMFNNDPFSNWMGIKLKSIEDNYCELECTVKAEMLNGFDLVHGGIYFSLADSAMAFAANASGQIALSSDVGISYFKPAKLGDELVAKARLIQQSKQLKRFEVEITNTENMLLAHFKGTVFITSNKHFDKP